MSASPLDVELLKESDPVPMPAAVHRYPQRQLSRCPDCAGSSYTRPELLSGKVGHCDRCHREWTRRESHYTTFLTLPVAPIGTALGGPLVPILAPDSTLLASGLGTIAAAGVAAVVLLNLRSRRTRRTGASPRELSSR